MISLRDSVITCLLVAACLVPRVSAWAKSSLAVFYPSALNARERQEALKSGLAGYDVEVFAKFRDFDEELKTKDVTVVIAPAYFQQSHPDFVPILGFNGRSGRKFKYELLSLSEKLEKANLNEAKNRPSGRGGS